MRKELLVAHSGAIKQQLVLSLALLPVTFGLWYAAGALFAAPAAWLASQLLPWLWPGIILDAGFDQTVFFVITDFGMVDNKIVAASLAGSEIVLEANSRLLSYSVPFYAALIWGTKLDNSFERFAQGLLLLWLFMLMGLLSIIAKDLMLVIGEPFLSQTALPPAAIALAYQFSVLLMPSLIPPFLWLWQIRNTDLWQQLAEPLHRSKAR